MNKAVSAIMGIGIVGMYLSAMAVIEAPVISALLLAVFAAITLLGNTVRKRLEDMEVCWK